MLQMPDSQKVEHLRDACNLAAQVAQLRQPLVSPLVQTRTLQRKAGEHERAKAKFEATLGTATNAEEYQERSVSISAPLVAC